MGSLRTIRDPVQAEVHRDRSRFLSFAYHVKSRADIDLRLRQLQHEFPDATHHCYAFRLLEKTCVSEFADDAAEPKGSAGKPILHVITGRGLTNVLVVIVRYFGGVKLGVGGLVRAYGAAAKAVLDCATIIQHRREIELLLRYPYAFTGEVMRLIHRYEANMVRHEYGDLPLAIVRVPAVRLDAFRRDLRDATRGQAESLQPASSDDRL
jgi:uncharacterized YigZ family protein